MKLYDVYLDCLKKIRESGELKAAWFTTFNMTIPFIEKYLLPPLLGVDAPPEHDRDYERINYLLADMNAPSIRFFADSGMIGASGKRTTVPVRSVWLEGDQFSGRFAHGVFHPKVIFLLGSHKAFIICGSANLTHAAWAKNRESVWWGEVNDNRNIDEIRFFFRELDPLEWRERVKPEVTAWKRRVHRTAKANWQFIHSFKKKGLWGNWLKSELDGQSLTVWSPYFCTQSVALVQAIQDQYGDDFSITLVPDIAENGSPPLSHTEGTKLLEAGVQFACDEASLEQKRLSHAKVWVCGNKVAIGSWNFTQRGAGLSNGGRSVNVEAGVLISDGKSGLAESLEIYEPEFCESDEVEGEPEAQGGISRTLTFVFSWATMILRLYEESLPKEEVFVRLGYEKFTDRVGLSKLEKGEFCPGLSSVLHRDRFLRVERLNGEIWGQGIVIEEDRDSRPCMQYDTLDEALMSWLHPTRRPLGAIRFSGVEEDDKSDEGTGVMLGDGVSLYRLFRATKCLYAEVESAVRAHEPKANGEFSQNYSLGALCFGLPGSLQELARGALNASEAPKKEQRVYLWFMLCELAKIMRLLSKRKLPLSFKQFGKNTQKELRKRAHEVLQLRGKDRRWAKRIMDKCGYE